MRAIRVVFERGLEIHRDEMGLWSFLPDHGTRLSMSPSEITQAYGVRPVLLAELHPSGREHVTLFSPSGREGVNPSPLVEAALHGSMTWLFRSLRYVLGAAFYHCGQLAQKYAQTWRSFHGSPVPFKAQSGVMNFVQHGFQEECYYEFDALVTSVMRCYGTMRFIIWRAFGVEEGQPKAGPPNNFEKTLSACGGLPSFLESRLSQSWSVFGKRAKHYRDFIQHYFPLDRGFAQARMERLRGDVWSALMLIPDNPEDKSPNHFAYNSQTDMLTYTWELTNEILEIADLTIKEVVNAQNKRGSNQPRAR